MWCIRNKSSCKLETILPSNEHINTVYVLFIWKTCSPSLMFNDLKSVLSWEDETGLLDRFHQQLLEGAGNGKSFLTAGNNLWWFIALLILAFSPIALQYKELNTVLDSSSPTFLSSKGGGGKKPLKWFWKRMLEELYSYILQASCETGSRVWMPDSYLIQNDLCPCVNLLIIVMVLIKKGARQGGPKVKTN